jgi:glycosyltransferase involved in cell wall biosynthesis
MRVCLVSTFPPTKCGVAHYCAKIERAMREVGGCRFIILADDAGDAENGARIDGNPKVVNVWKRDTFLYPFKLFRAVVSEKPDVIHIQHEYFLYGKPLFSALLPILLILLRIIRKPIVITMHSVIPRKCLNSSFFEKYGSGKKLEAIKRICVFLMTFLIGVSVTKTIVHLESARRTLIDDYEFRSAKVFVIPHGVDILERKFDQHHAKLELNLEGKRILLFFGFVRPEKGVKYSIEAMPDILRKFPDAVLMIVGASHPYLGSGKRSYLDEMKELVHELKLEKSVLFVSKFVPDQELPVYLIAADVIVLPYTESDILGASGALAGLKSFEKPIIATRIRRFIGDINDRENGILIPPSDSTSLATAAILLLSDPKMRQNIGTRLYNEAKINCWENVAQRTIGIYTDLISNRRLHNSCRD